MPFRRQTRSATCAQTAAVLRTALRIDDAERESRAKRAAALMMVNSRTPRFSPIRVKLGANPGYLRLAVLDVTGSVSPEPRLGVLRGYPITLVMPESYSQERRKVVTAFGARLEESRGAATRSPLLPRSIGALEPGVAALRNSVVRNSETTATASRCRRSL